jgi:hypothetical protein
MQMLAVKKVKATSGTANKLNKSTVHSPQHRLHLHADFLRSGPTNTININKRKLSKDIPAIEYNPYISYSPK